jgi:hypothetical protein
MSNDDTVRFVELLHRLRVDRFRDLAGSRLTTSIPVSEKLVNELIAASLPPNAPVRSVAIRPEAADRFSVRIVPRAALIPAMTLQLAIERQPHFPGQAVLTMRMVTLGGLFGLASAVIAGFLPPAVRLDADRIHVDLRALAAARGGSELFEYVTSLQIHSDGGRFIVNVDAAVPPG